MSEPGEKAFLDLLLSNLPGDVKHAMMILVDDDGNIETAEANLGPENMMLVCFSLACSIAQDLKSSGKYPADYPTEHRNGKTKPLLYLPPDLQRKLDQL